MSVNLYNSEGYLDTTAYAALTNIEQEARRDAYRPLVFICSPYAGDRERNAQRARAFCRFAVSEHCIPIAPHLLFPQAGFTEQMPGGMGFRRKDHKGDVGGAGEGP